MWIHAQEVRLINNYFVKKSEHKAILSRQRKGEKWRRREREKGGGVDENIRHVLRDWCKHCSKPAKVTDPPPLQKKGEITVRQRQSRL